MTSLFSQVAWVALQCASLPEGLRQFPALEHVTSSDQQRSGNRTQTYQADWHQTGSQAAAFVLLRMLAPRVLLGPRILPQPQGLNFHRPSQVRNSYLPMLPGPSHDSTYCGLSFSAFAFFVWCHQAIRKFCHAAGPRKIEAATSPLAWTSSLITRARALQSLLEPYPSTKAASKIHQLDSNSHSFRPHVIESIHIMRVRFCL